MSVVAVDGTNLLIRSFFAHGDLRSPSGLPTGAAFGLANRVREAAEARHPDRVIVCWDGGRSAWRRRLYPAYKNRPPSTERRSLDDCYAQKPVALELLAAMGADSVEVPGVEADDLVARFALASDRATILSTDRDYWQLVSDRVDVFQGLGDGSTNVDAGSFRSATGFASPGQWIAYRVVNGDASDNIGRVRGLSGEKRFAKVWETLVGLGYAGDTVAFFVDQSPADCAPPDDLAHQDILARVWDSWDDLARNAALMDLRFGARAIGDDMDLQELEEVAASAAEPGDTLDDVVDYAIASHTDRGRWDRRAFERLAGRLNFQTVLRDLRAWEDALGTLAASEERA